MMHVVQGPPGKQPLAEGGYPVEIEVINNNYNAYELICGYALNILLVNSIINAWIHFYSGTYLICTHTCCKAGTCNFFQVTGQIATLEWSRGPDNVRHVNEG